MTTFLLIIIVRYFFFSYVSLIMPMHIVSSCFDYLILFITLVFGNFQHLAQLLNLVGIHTRRLKLFETLF